MSDSITKTVYIIPPLVDEKASVVHSSCYRLALSILRRANLEPVTISIESMSYTALIYENKILFADNSAMINHAEASGHPITMEWLFFIAEDRNDNDQHIPMKIKFHRDDLSGVQQQLTGEFYKAMMQLDQQYSEDLIPASPLDVISISSMQTDPQRKS